jgi:drug/metabolite transporter (DMT)-like permease
MWLFVFLILVVGVNDFIVKVSTNSLDGLKGALIMLTTFGLLYSIYLIRRTNNTSKKASKNNSKNHFGNIWKICKYTLITGALGLLAWVFFFMAMGGLPATIVSSLATSQAFFVMIIEFFTNKYFAKISRDKTLIYKIAGILFIVAGVVLLTLNT